MTLPYILLCIVAGVASAWIMHALMLAVSRTQEVPVNIVRALGSFGTGRVDDRATRIGFAAHTAGGAVLGLIYGGILHLLGIAAHPVAFLVGAVLGFFHGLVVAYVLMYYVAERHPVAAYRRATMPVGAIHLFGHLFYGIALVAIIFVFQGLAGIDDGTRANEEPRELRLDQNPP